MPWNRKGKIVGQWTRGDFEVNQSRKIEMMLDDDDAAAADDDEEEEDDDDDDTRRIF
jgi:hypothetical protein